MKDVRESFMAVMFVKVVTINMLLSVFFLLGFSAACPWRRHLNQTTPKRMEALTGSCLHIPCSFMPSSTFDSQKEIVAVWIKNQPSPPWEDNVIFKSNQQNNVYPMKMIGNLNQKNCTTLFSNLTKNYTDRYYFRIESEAFKATDFCNRLQIIVEDSPQKPRINISVDDLKENQSVIISCSASTPCPQSPPKLSWNLQQDSPQHTEENTDGSFTTKINQTITLSHTHDGYTITCFATYPVDGGEPVKTSETQESLSVSYAPKNTSVSISLSGLLPGLIWMELSCSSRAKPPVSSFTWFKITGEGRVKVHEGQVYSFSLTDMADLKSYYCEAANVLGSQRSPSHLDIEDVQVSWVHVNITVKILGILLLFSTIIIFECWIRCRYSSKAKKETEEADQVYRVIQMQAL